VIEPISPNNLYASTSKTLTFIVVSFVNTYLTPPTIGEIDYYVGDPLLSVSLPTFTNSDSRFNVLYNLTNTTGQTLDSTLITYN
jgi:hypothetical protein